MRKEIYAAMTKQIGAPELFTFLDEVQNDYLCACVMRSIVTSFPVNDASVQDALNVPVIPNEPDVGDSDDENDEIADDMKMADFVDEIEEDTNKEKFGIKCLPWKSDEYTPETLVRLSQVASILTKFYDSPIHRRTIWGNRGMFYTYEITKWKKKYPNVVEKISKRAKNFEFAMSARYRGALAFLLRYFVSVMVSKMRTAGDTQSVSIQGKAFICPGYLHANGGVHELAENGGLFTRVNGERSVFFSVDQNFGDDPATKDVPKDMWLPWLPLWPKGSVGVIARGCGNSVYVVQLAEEKGTLEKIFREVYPDKDIPGDLSFGLWKWTEGTGVRVCSHNMKCFSNMCSFCHGVTVDERCICTSLETRKMNAFYTLNYENDESYRIRFEECQILFLNPAILKRDKPKNKHVVAYIEKVVGPLLRLKILGRSQRVELHFLDPNINVPLQGSGPVHTLKKYEFQRGVGTTTSFLTKLTELFCFKCQRGPKLDHGCNWCGSVHVGYNVEVACAKGKEGTCDFSSFLNEYINDVKLLNAMCGAFFQERNAATREPLELTSYADAKVLHEKIRKSIKGSRGLFQITYNSSSVHIFRTDTEHFEFFRLYDKCEKNSTKAEFAMKTLNCNYSSRLSTWVQPNSVLHDRMKDEINELCVKMTKQKRNSVQLQLSSMAEDNDILSGLLETSTIHYNLHEPSFPFMNLCESVKRPNLLHTHVVQYTLQGVEYTVSSKLTVESVFKLCSCRTRELFGFSNMMCSGPLMGIDTDRERDIRSIVTFKGSESFYREHSEEHASVFFLTRIYRLDIDNSMKDEQLFVMYIFCMFMWYALSGKTFDVSAPRTIFPRGKSLSELWSIAENISNSRYNSDKDSVFESVVEFFSPAMDPEPRHTVKLSWYERFKTAPYCDFVDAFYGTAVSTDYQTYCGPAPKKCRTETVSISDFPSKDRVKELIEMSISFVEASLPFNGSKVFDSPSKIENSVRRWRVSNNGMCARSLMKDLYPGNFDIGVSTYSFYREMWLNIYSLGLETRVCRSPTEFHRILRGYEMIHPPMKRKISAVLCTNDDCEQCEILSLLQLHIAGQPVPDMKKLKDFCNADRQIEAFGEWVDLQICKHYLKFDECWTCLNTYKPCKKNSNCVCINDWPICFTRQTLSLDMYDGSSVKFSDPNVDCKRLKFSRDQRKGILRGEDDSTTQLPGNFLMFSAEECKRYDL